MDQTPKRDWNVLLIGGGTGTGKSTLARELGRLFDVDVLDGDDLRLAIEAAVPAGGDSNLHIFRTPGFWSLPVYENVARTLGWALRLCEITEAVVARRHFIRRPLIIEAVWLLPEFAMVSRFDGIDMKDEVRALFLVEKDPEQLRERLFARDGEAGLPANQPRRLEAFAEHGRIVAERAGQLGLPVLGSRPAETLLSRAVDALCAG